jgi:MFS family permease
VPRCLDARPTSPPACRLRTHPRRAFNVLLVATLLSVAGDGITQIGVPWFVLMSTGSPGKAGVVALCTMLPAAVGSLLGGTVVDRGGARRVSVVSDAACCMVVMTVPALQLTGALHFWELCALMALAGLLHAPGNTARAVMLPALASRSHLPLSRAAGMSAGAARAASIIGSAAGGVLVTALGAGNALFVDAGTFAASAVLIAAGIRRSDLVTVGQARRAQSGRRGRRYRRDVRDGLRLVTATPLLLGHWSRSWPSKASRAARSTRSISITYRLTPEHVRGRAIGTMTATALAAPPFGALAAGRLIDSIGLTATTAVFGCVYLAVTLIPAVFPLYKTMSEREEHASSDASLTK